MKKDNGKSVVIFGGAGFVGTHLTRYLVENNLADKIYCVDILEPRYIHHRVVYIRHDIRERFDIEIKNIMTVYNLAAVHTTPGYPDEDYFETNIRGAQNICSFASRNSVETIVFTSSISPYGSSEDPKREVDLPQPKTAYGTSKFIAEYVHKCWLNRSIERRLVVVRPGVVFGSGEGGNFTRLYRSLKKGYFFYPGRKDTKKACIYVKDLVRALYEMSRSTERFQMYNMCYPESPSIETIVDTISYIAKVPNNCAVMPGILLKSGAGIVSSIFKLMGKENGINPDRVEKLMLSTNISGEKLATSPYALRFSLKEAIEDWYNDCGKKALT